MTGPRAWLVATKPLFKLLGDAMQFNQLLIGSAFIAIGLAHCFLPDAMTGILAHAQVACSDHEEISRFVTLQCSEVISA